MVVNDDTCFLGSRGALESIASMLVLHVRIDIDREITSGDFPVFLHQANTKYLRTVSTTSQVPFIPGSMTKMSPARRWIGSFPSGVMMQ